MNINQSIGPHEPPISPPEAPDPEPTRHDPVPIEDVYQWRDKIKDMVHYSNMNNRERGKLSDLLESMNDSIDTAHGLNDPQPEEE